MKGYIGVTDNDWFSFLASQPEIDEVNFWQPSGGNAFRTLSKGEPFLFKLHAPYNYVAGGGFFAHHSILPVSLAWTAFDIKNGAESFGEMRRLIEKRRRTVSTEDYRIGCIILTQPFFFPPDQWIPIPPDFSLNIVQGKTYDLLTGHGRSLWDQVLERLTTSYFPAYAQSGIMDPAARYGKPALVLPRLGQGAFRIVVTDAYQRRCSITGERTLPALEAAHIKPYKESGPHDVQNGLLLRSDIHRLFDSGYVTVTTDHRFEVSGRIREEFENGRDYYRFHGSELSLPADTVSRPQEDYLQWHNENVYLG